MYQDDRTRIHHMLDAARKIVANSTGHGRVDLDHDENLSIVLTFWVQRMGEASRMVSRDLKDRRPEIPWTQIEGMRHRIVHDYDRIDLDIVWGVATADAPALISPLGAILGELEAEEE